MNTYLALLNAVAAVAFGVAIVFALRVSSDRASRGVQSLIIVTGLACLFIAVSNVLEHGYGYLGFDPIEDYMEILFIPLLVYTAYALNMHASQQRVRRSSELVSLQCDLLLQILDISPVGTMVVDDYGKITFASEGARKALDLVEATDGFSAPSWRLLDAEERELERGFGSLCAHGEREEDTRLQLAWPDGMRSWLLVSAAPMADRTGRVGACVVALEDVQTRMAALSS